MFRWLSVSSLLLSLSVSLFHSHLHLTLRRCSAFPACASFQADIVLERDFDELLDLQFDDVRHIVSSVAPYIATHLNRWPLFIPGHGETCTCVNIIFTQGRGVCENRECIHVIPKEV